MENSTVSKDGMRRCVFAAAAAAVFLLLLFSSLFLYTNARLNKMECEMNELRSTPVSVVQAPAIAYTLREYRGRIGIFSGSRDTPLQTLDICVFTLPENDRAALEKGIRVYSEEALRSLIEDFTG